MAADEKTDNTGGGRPFQLRPSILSGSGFGSPLLGAGSVGGDKQNKGFMLRPSALTSAADSLHKADTRKRQLSDEESQKSDGHDETLKKPKVTEESSSATTSNEAHKIKLTEDIQKPTGIGTFGFDQDKNRASGLSNEHNNKDTENKNYFAQTINPNDKLGFVFGNKTTSTAVGFSALKKDDHLPGADNENGDSKDTDNVSTTENSTESAMGFGRNTSHEKLLENATEYEKTHNNRQHFEEVEQFTGEEGEQHVLHIFCKLHVFDKEKKNWLERGRGNLKLNDKCQAEGYFQSRLVFRTQGTNLVQLNTKLWPDMCCEKVKEKSIRISALDPETKEVRVYLITASMKDVLQAYTAIDRRIGALKRSRNSGEKGDEVDDEAGNENSNDSTKDVSSENEDDSNSENEQETKRQITPGNTECSKPDVDSSVKES